MITGFIAGSLAIIWPWKRPDELVMKGGEEKVISYESYFPQFDANFAIALAIIVVGVVVMRLVEKLGSAQAK